MKQPIIFFIIFAFMSFGYAQNVFWAYSGSGSALDEGEAIAIDNAGNTYIAGSFESAVLNFGTHSVMNAGNSDIFVAKFDPNGVCLWAKSVGGSDEEYGTAITVDKINGNVYVAGHFRSTSISFAGQTINNIGNYDLILLKYNTSGDEIWGKSIGGTNVERTSGLGIDQNENIYLTGMLFSNSVNFGTESITNNGYVDVFIAKFDKDGNNIWAKGAGGSDNDRSFAISTDSNGNSVITGFFESASITFGTTTLYNTGSYDCLFVAKYDSTGSALWAKSYESTGGDIYGSAISIDNHGNVFVSGTFRGSSVTFTTTLTNVLPGSSNAFLLKLDALGNPLWGVNPTSGPQGNQSYCVSTDAIGNSYISGWFTSPSINFGGIILNSTASGDNIFLAKYNSDGLIQNAYCFKGNNASGGYGNSICNDVSGNVYLTGYFEGINMMFDTITLTNTGSYDVYWTKIGTGTSSINEVFNMNQLLVYPNPATDIVTISFPNPENKAMTLSVYDNRGKHIEKVAHISGTQIHIETTDIQSGIYILTLSDNKAILGSGILIVK